MRKRGKQLVSLILAGALVSRRKHWQAWFFGKPFSLSISFLRSI